MQGEPQEGQAFDHRKRFLGRGQRRHATTHGFAAGDEGKVARKVVGSLDRCPDRREQDWPKVRATPSRLHVRELVSEGGHADFAEGLRYRCHEGMPHPGPRAVAQDVQAGRMSGPEQEAGNITAALGREKLDRLFD